MFIDNRRLDSHHSVVFGIRELNQTEFDHYCTNLSTVNMQAIRFASAMNFSANYQLRVYTSGCYYADGNYDWKSDGLWVSDRFHF